MTAKTHKKVSVCFALLGAFFLRLENINYYVMVVMLVTFSDFGRKFPDFDHHWESVSDKTTVSWLINKFIRLTGGRHRSRHTHSLDLSIALTYGLLWLNNLVYELGLTSSVDKDIITLIISGFALGWFSHLYADILNYTGIYLSCLFKCKLRLVPRKLFGVEFKTGDEWERFVCKSHVYINALMGIWVLSYPILKELGILDSLGL